MITNAFETAFPSIGSFNPSNNAMENVPLLSHIFQIRKMS